MSKKTSDFEIFLKEIFLPVTKILAVVFFIAAPLSMRAFSAKDQALVAWWKFDETKNKKVKVLSHRSTMQ